MGNKMHVKIQTAFCYKNHEGRGSAVPDVTPIVSSMTVYNWGISLIQFLGVWEQNGVERNIIMNLNLPEEDSFASQQLDF